MLRTDEPEQTLLLPSVYLHLDMRQQFRGVLDLVNQKRRREPLEEESRILFGQGPDQGVIQGDVSSVFFREMPQERRFTYLPGSCDQQDRELFRRRKEERYNGTGNIHFNNLLSSNMHSDCTIADNLSIVKTADRPRSLNSPPEVPLRPRFEFVDLMALLDLSKEFLVQGGTCFPIILPGPDLLKVETLLAFPFLTEKFSQKPPCFFVPLVSGRYQATYRESGLATDWRNRKKTPSP